MSSDEERGGSCGCRLRGASVRMVLVVSVVSAALAYAVPAFAAGSITGSRSDPPALEQSVNLATQGPIDWAVWGYANTGHSTSLAPDARKIGGNAISSLEDIHASGAPLRGLGQFPDVAAYRFSWSSGDNPLRESLAAGGIQHDGEPTPAPNPQPGESTLGDGFGFTVPAGLEPRTVKVYAATNRADAKLTAHLSDGSSSDYVDVLPAGIDQHTAVYTITYQAGSAGQTLHVTWVETADHCGAPFHCDNAGIYAVALTRTFVVNSTASHVPDGCDPINCTLGDALTDANADAGGSIEFNLGDGPFTIPVDANVPEITKPVSVDGYTQTGATPNTNDSLADGDNAVPLVQLSSGVSGDGLTFGPGSDGSSVRGLIFGGFSDAISVGGASDVTVAGNFIGTDGTGSPDFFGNGSGVYLDGGVGHTIGGPEAADRNVISDNFEATDTGIDLDGTANVLVQGNYVGTDPTGMLALANDDGVAIFGGATDNVVSGNVISGNEFSGVRISGQGTARNTVVMNLIGVAADGSIPLPNRGAGVVVAPDVGGDANTIGGPLGGNTIGGNLGDGIDVGGNGNGTVIQGNAVIGNQNHGIFVGGQFGDPPGVAIKDNRIAGSGLEFFDGIGIYFSNYAGSATVTGNTIGLDAAGTGAEPNTGDGIRIENSSGVVIGGTTPADRNVVAGNVGHGIHLNNASTGDVVKGNYVGVNAAGSAAVPNGVDGISIDGANGNTISGNLSSGNTGMGISLFSGSTGNVVQGNTIGLDAAGTNGIPNFEGIRLDGATNNTIGAPATGDPPAGAANEVARNTRSGIAVYQASSARNSVRANRVHDNGELGIDLSLVTASSVVHADGVTANDVGDGDSGPNGLQNFPVLKTATTKNGTTPILGTLSTVGNGTYTVDFYASPVCDGSGNGEGAVWIGYATLPLNGTSGSDRHRERHHRSRSTRGDAITATATDAAGNTSEFSRLCRPPRRR